jgi:hypothetical protein
MSKELTVTRRTENGRLFKPLNQHDFLGAGTRLAAIRDKKVRIAQTRLGDIDEIHI